MTNLPRYWRDSNFPRPRSPKYPDETTTMMMQVLEGMAYKSRNNPEQLATVLAAFCRIGFPPLNWDMGVEHGGGMWVPGYSVWTREEAHEACVAAMRGRSRSVLTKRADGLLLALEHYGEDILAKHKHDRAVEVEMRECRELSLDERAERYAKSRAMEAIGG